MRYAVLDTPIGPLGVGVDRAGLCAVHFAAPPAAGPGGNGPDGEAGRVLDLAREQLVGYFAGTVTDFTLPLSVRGGSEFERAVWSELARIPYAEMRTYGEIAQAVGDAGAARAVGTACNRNPLPIVIPCHRVVGADGKLVGFGGGLPRKRLLLELEARVRIESTFG